MLPACRLKPLRGSERYLEKQKEAQNKERRAQCEQMKGTRAELRKALLTRLRTFPLQTFPIALKAL